MSLHCGHKKTFEDVDLNNIFHSKPQKKIKSIDIKTVIVRNSVHIDRKQEKKNSQS